MVGDNALLVDVWLQCIAVRCGVLQYGAVWCSVLQCAQES